VELSSRFGAVGTADLEVLSEDSGLVLGRGRRENAAEGRRKVLVVIPASEQPSPAILNRIAHEYSFKDELDSTWAVRPLELARDRGRTVLVLEDPGGELLGGLLGTPMEVGRFLRIAVGVASALGKVHQQGLIHKDIKPANILVNIAGGGVRLTGFGIASRLTRERQLPDAPEVIAGTLAYMAPEQTGRMNRSIDSRSDLYSLGVTFYEMLTGGLPFTASDPMEWVHCHIARQPHAPSERASGIPETLSSIVMKLLAKNAEDRYQTAAGVEADLQRCMIKQESHGRIDPFPVGLHDGPDRLLISEKLYGRDAEIDVLLAAFDRVVAHGEVELVLVSGYSGIGKSSIVNELHKALVPPRGLFAAGKFDQYRRGVPYATLAQAFQNLVRGILSKSEAELERWRRLLLEALGSNGQLMVTLIPELAFVIGEQPPVPDLPPQDAQNRFQTVFVRFLGAFARPEHPLALFLDDLQWLDTATLELLEHVATGAEVRHLMLVGAYRDNEVSTSHPLMRTLETIRKSGQQIQDIVLTPLTRNDVRHLVADCLRAEFDRVRPLAELVFEKTSGNPFFVMQFVTALEEQQLLTFNPKATAWDWDLSRIQAKGFTDNVVDLMAAKLDRLPATTQQAMKSFACLGNASDIATLTLVYGKSEEDLHLALEDAVRGGLVFRFDASYAFAHDRVHEAAYELIDREDRPVIHLDIGRMLTSQMAMAEIDDKIFEVVDQFNRGISRIDLPSEREQVAQLFLTAGKRAKESAAYSSALMYFTTGRELLPDGSWIEQYPLLFDLEINCAECEYLTGAFAAAENRLSALARRATDIVDKAAVARQHISLHTVLDRLDRASDIGLEFLRHVGIIWSPHPTSDDVDREYAEIWRRIDGRAIEQLVDLPLMTDPGWRATVDVLVTAASPARFTDSNLSSLILGRIINLSLEHGHTDGSCFAYVYSDLAFDARSGDHRAGFRFAKLGFDLMESRNLLRFKPKVYLGFALSNSWVTHLSESHVLLRRTFEAARDVGDVVYMGYALRTLLTNLIASGAPLAETESEADHALEFARKAGFGLVFDIISGQRGLIRTLRGRTLAFGSFNDREFDESSFDLHLQQDQRLAFAAYLYSVRKLQALYYAGDYLSALEAEEKAGRFLSQSPSYYLYFDATEYCFYGALARAAYCGPSTADERSQHYEMLHAHHKRLKKWAEHGPENLANRTALIGAEIARLDGSDLDAQHLYEEAIRSARKYGFVQNEGLANELAAKFYAERGFETIANAYLANARTCYHDWGADGKVKQLDRLYPHLTATAVQRPAATIDSRVQLDVTSVVKASQALSGEIELPKLIDRLMTIAVENAGADRGLLMLPAGDEYLVQAEARASGDRVEVTMSQEPITGMTCPESLVRYVIRTRESVILDDASKPNLFSADNYLRDRQSKSVLCLPLIKQQQLTGILLLENTLTSHAFTPARIAVLEMLAAQAAISLENTRLYGDLREREAKVRRLVDSNIIGICVFNLDRRITEANDTFLNIVGYSRDDVGSGRLSFATLTPPEWEDVSGRGFLELASVGTCSPYEKEYVRKDNSRVPVLVGGAAFGELGQQALAFVVDLTERKRAEAELAHANRVATMGQLTASIAHEVSQPIAAMIISAGTAVRWLARQPVNLEGARQSIDRIVSDGKRASDVLNRIRDFAKKAPVRKENFEINEAISEVTGLTRAMMSDNGVVPKIQLSEGLPYILGDRVQLQQVILNLIMNAIEAMSEVGEGARELLISTSQDELGGVLVAVSDSGPGLPHANRERIFDAFYTTKASGLGMGLSICRSIVEAHGGRLWATPNQPRGAVFCMRLPTRESLEEQESSEAR
jgi:PAS domain S-box-containing protein